MPAQQKRTWVIQVKGPFSPTVNQQHLIKGYGDDLFAFNGKSTYNEIYDACKRLAPHCGLVRAFVGSDTGRLVWEFAEGKLQDFCTV